MIDVNDLAQIVRPVCPAMRFIRARPAGRWLAQREHGSNRCEEIAPVKAGRMPLRLPNNVPAARACGTALNQLEQAVARADVPPAARLPTESGTPSPHRPD